MSQNDKYGLLQDFGDLSRAFEDTHTPYIKPTTYEMGIFKGLMHEFKIKRIDRCLKVEADIAESQERKTNAIINKNIAIATAGERIKSAFITFEAEKQMLELDIIHKRQLIQGVMMDNDLKHQQVLEAKYSARTSLLNCRAQEINMRREYGDDLGAEDWDKHLGLPASQN